MANARPKSLPSLGPGSAPGLHVPRRGGSSRALDLSTGAPPDRPLGPRKRGSRLLLASIIFNVPFIVQPVQRAFEAIPRNLAEAAAVSGLSSWQTFWRVELPLAWPGVLSAMVLTFVHTLGEFGVVLMMGGSIPGETKTIAISIYDRVQAFDLASADRMALLLLVLSLSAVAASFFASSRLMVRR